MNSKALWTLAAFVAWSAGSTYWYVCKIKGFCSASSGSASPTEAVVSTPEEKGSEAPSRDTIVWPQGEAPLYFRAGDSQPFIPDTARWEALKARLISESSADKRLQIRLPASENETAEVRRARARAVKALLAPETDTAAVMIVFVTAPPQGEWLAVGGEDFQWLRRTENVRETRDRVIIHFPMASDRAILTPDVNRYLDELAAELKANPGLKARITGYTDDTGPEEVNMWWGMARAKRIAALLNQKGVPEEQLIVESGGESRPIAPNDTEEGRRQNRRVEIILVQP